MLAAAREIKINGAVVAKTPMLIPSFSSKGFPEVSSIITALSQSITECTLVSAYDIAHGFVSEVPKFPALLILDSGGYECSSASELSDHKMNIYRELPWSEAEHRAVLDSWNAPQPTLAVTYDHPKDRLDVPGQIVRARSLFQQRSFGREILIKPDTERSIRINVESVVTHAHEFRDFDVLGFTEVELGYSIFERMKSIALVRTALTKVGINIPIHIFGSLDTISTPLYFLAGADMFDGLTWLRYAYSEDMAVYQRNVAALKYSIRINDVDIPPKIWFENYQKIQNLQLSMKRFIREKNFNVFSGDSEFFERSTNELMAEV